MIKNIIFDFGDVFLNIDKKASFLHLKQFGYDTITAELDQLFKQYEMGLVNSENFLKALENTFPKMNRTQLLEAWNAILLDFPLYRLEFLEALAAEKKYRLFLLSNTNELHIAYERETMGDHFTRFENCFESFYLSYEMGLRKPDIEIYKTVLQVNGLTPHKTLFVDDTYENVAAAESVGIRGWHLKVGQEEVIELRKHL